MLDPLMPSRWPDDLRCAFFDAHGALISQERLGGMSGAEVYRLMFADHIAILKITPQAAEPHFYQSLAPTLRAHAINVPELEFSTYHDARHWLVLEYIPQPLPRERWLGDRDMLAMLSRLHTLEIQIPSGYQPKWGESMTEDALAAIGDRASMGLGARLHESREAYQHLFEPECVISADPNPANWGLRADGRLVLFDWERLTRATPAIDLAITVPSLPTADQFAQVASAYIVERVRQNNPYLIDEAQLAQDMAAAKLWTLIEFAHEHQRGTIDQPAAVEWIGENIEAWLASLGL